MPWSSQVTSGWSGSSGRLPFWGSRPAWAGGAGGVVGRDGLPSGVHRLLASRRSRRRRGGAPAGRRLASAPAASVGADGLAVSVGQAVGGAALAARRRPERRTVRRPLGSATPVAGGSAVVDWQTRRRTTSRGGPAELVRGRAGRAAGGGGTGPAQATSGSAAGPGASPCRRGRVGSCRGSRPRCMVALGGHLGLGDTRAVDPVVDDVGGLAERLGGDVVAAWRPGGSGCLPRGRARGPASTNRPARRARRAPRRR